MSSYKQGCPQFLWTSSTYPAALGQQAAGSLPGAKHWQAASWCDSAEIDAFGRDHYRMDLPLAGSVEVGPDCTATPNLLRLRHGTVGSRYINRTCTGFAAGACSLSLYIFLPVMCMGMGMGIGFTCFYRAEVKVGVGLFVGITGQYCG